MADITDLVKKRYGKAALRVTAGDAGCCAPGCCGDAAGVPGGVDPITANLADHSRHHHANVQVLNEASRPWKGRVVMTDIKDVVKERYGQAALRVTGGNAGCCAPGCCGDAAGVPGAVDPITANLYEQAQTAGLPAEAVLASLGCGNPTALAELHAGETVLDLGSGGGIDVLLSARRVGPAGKAYGLDMTDEMLALARENQRKAGVGNVEFLKGEIEHIPLPDDSVDVIISNCVINLSADKDRVLREAFRVLKPGGRFAVSDVVTRGEVPAVIRRSVELWIGCLSGALDETDYIAKLIASGFDDVSIEPTRVYKAADARAFLEGHGIDVDEVAPQVDGRFFSGFIRARKPAA